MRGHQTNADEISILNEMISRSTEVFHEGTTLANEIRSNDVIASFGTVSQRTELPERPLRMAGDQTSASGNGLPLVSS